MKYIVFILSILSLSVLKTDNESSLIVNYTYSIHIETLPSATVVNSTLIDNGKESLYEMDFVGNSNLTEEEAGDNGSVLSIKPSRNPYIYKDKEKKEFYSIQRISMKPYLIRDNMNIFKWTLEKDTKDILGYKCQAAKAHYRGRDYIAYFTTEVPFKNGPWKFSGLPGLILEVKSVDNVFSLVANSLELKNSKAEISNPYEKKKAKAISWDEFIKKYKRKHEELKHYRNESGGYRSIPRKNIETYIED